MEKAKQLYPFSAIVGQEDMKKGLLLNSINPLLGGVLIRGEKGTAKSTAVRALAQVLPLREQVEDCPFHCDPADDSFWCGNCREAFQQEGIRSSQGRMRVINLPVSATEDRVVGTLDIEHAIKKGEKRFEPGILAEANRNILYVDEVNLLDDHVVDVLLDAAAMGVNSIEREGVSYSHPSRFVLVGTMNPEEGDLRPQLIDRFGLVVDVKGEEDTKERVEIIKRRLAFENNPTLFSKDYEDAEQRLTGRIAAAKELLSQVTYSPECLGLVAEIGITLGVDGHRADITFIKAAITHAAFRGSERVAKEDMLIAAKLALPHRMRRRPFEESSLDFERVYDLIEKSAL
ncbi:Magnesium-chelatase subunit ChlI homolog [Desulfitobacterium hafniense]|uniref:Magnesium-chelatase subunit ChlI homolog n=1 Tax=Desulfitobacterium hafniense TaxID=49338 RepID=A0A098B6Q4_DESHA|nr:AAA family ATPase [Desulfitobacterium hafniense]CDX04060.1 Magnesium-chelatase subunit ChlI homolog [Desulfitobacterium hafniense]